MKNYITLGAALALSLTSLSVIGDQMKFDPSKSSVLKEEDKKFNVVMEPISFADAYGSRETGPHGTYGQFPANFETPNHTHSNSYHAIVLKGEMTNPFTDEKNPPVMGPGSHWFVAAGEAHTTACVSDVPCEFFMYSDKGFDFAPVE